MRKIKKTPFNSLFATFADLHVRKRATFADLQLYTRLWFIRIAQWSDYHCFWFALSACVINLPFWNFSYNLHVKRYSELNIVLLHVAPIPVCPKIMWHTGDLYLANKELKKNVDADVWENTPFQRFVLDMGAYPVMCWVTPPPPPRKPLKHNWGFQ